MWVSIKSSKAGVLLTIGGCIRGETVVGLLVAIGVALLVGLWLKVENGIRSGTVVGSVQK